MKFERSNEAKQAEIDRVRRGPLDPYLALRLPRYRLYVMGRNVSGIGDAMQSIVVSWELYARTHNPMILGWVGLVQVAPVLLFAIPAGHVADQYSRKTVAIVAQSVFTLCTLVLAALSWTHAAIPLFYLCLFCGMTARAFGNPARAALLPQIVTTAQLGNAISWDTSIRRLAVMSGQALGGYLLEFSGKPTFARLLPAFAASARTVSSTHRAGQPLFAIPAVVYLTTATLGTLGVLLLCAIKLNSDVNVADRLRKTAVTWETLIGGIRYIRSNRIILETITLDLFAVLFGGATALLPIYQKEILHVGPEGLGWLRASSSLGALVMALATAHLPPIRKPGAAMLWAVTGFGVATVVFGLSKDMRVSLIALACLGALDMISVVVRQTLIQTLTIDEMRGRVNAVNAIFINSSNEIGAFESGLAARIGGTVFSVVSGGIASVIVAVGASVKWPALRSYDIYHRGNSTPDGPQ